tara:strand:+ start:225 stop:647 length:423 start_codon:yes stop_codon:yes gene_type:complete
MKKLILIVLFLTSCGSTYNASTDYKIKSILTITEKGDTLAVPVRDFKFRILDRRIQEIVNRDLFRYQYRQNWQPWNYNFYSIPHVNNRSNFNRPNINVKPNVNVRPNIPVNPYTKPINTNPSNGNTTIISKPSTNKLNKN